MTSLRNATEAGLPSSHQIEGLQTGRLGIVELVS